MNPAARSDALYELAAALRRATRVAVLTGAGISAESGLRTFRGVTAAAAGDLPSDMAALWKEFDPMTLATPEAFAADPGMITRWYDWRRRGCLAAEPNPGHVTLTRIEHLLTARGGTLTLLTQNVDRLHQRAGSRRVVELHGTIMEWRCERTGHKITPGDDALERTPWPSPFVADAWMRPDVVWFGEMLPEAALDAAEHAATTCDVFLSIGTSAQVYPAAGFVQVAASRGARTAEINAEETPISRRVDWSIRGRSSEVLPELARLIEDD